MTLGYGSVVHLTNRSWARERPPREPIYPPHHVFRVLHQLLVPQEHDPVAYAFVVQPALQVMHVAAEPEQSGGIVGVHVVSEMQLDGGSGCGVDVLGAPVGLIAFNDGPKIANAVVQAEQVQVRGNDVMVVSIEPEHARMREVVEEAAGLLRLDQRFRHQERITPPTRSPAPMKNG